MLHSTKSIPRWLKTKLILIIILYFPLPEILEGSDCKNPPPSANLTEELERFKFLQFEYSEQQAKLQKLEKKAKYRMAVFNGLVSAFLNVNPDQVNFHYCYSVVDETYSLEVYSRSNIHNVSNVERNPINFANPNLRHAFYQLDKISKIRKIENTKLSWKTLEAITDQIGFELRNFSHQQFICLTQDMGIAEEWTESSHSLEIERAKVFNQSFEAGRRVDLQKQKIREMIQKNDFKDGDDNILQKLPWEKPKSMPRLATVSL